MKDGSAIRVRLLPDGTASSGVLVSSSGRVLEIEMLGPQVECPTGAPAELENDQEIFLGIVGRRQDNRLWVTVEHRLDRTPLAALRAAWREG